jgi:WD40 repeat protein/tRNA A-37 threonylcarbamoyl transferase component Bud32
VACPKCGREFRLDEAAEDTVEAAAPGQITPPPLPNIVRPEIPARLGRFEIRCRVGAGAFGVVYRAYDALLDREVALKVPHAGRLDSEKDKARFVREAKAAAKLRHPNIVPVYEAGEHDGGHYLAAAFIEGRTLRETLEHQPLEFSQAARLMRNLAEALYHAHRQGVVHRDIKPANIILDGNGDPLVMDFGLARFQEGTEKLTHDGTLLGTPAYMSPEQAAGRLEAVGPAADQYSLGVVLYELLCGETPFTGPPTLVISLVVHQEPRRPRAVNPAIPRDLETICLRAMAKRPEDRYADCSVLAEDLRRWEAGEVIRARRVGPVERLARWCRKNPMLAALSLSTMLLLLGVATITTLAYLREVELRQGIQAAVHHAGRARQGESDALREAHQQRQQAENNAAQAKHEQQEAERARTLAQDRATELQKQKEETEAQRQKAVAAAADAKSERDKARQAAERAQIAQQQAETSLAEAERQRLRVEANLYVSDMNHALHALEQGEFARMEELLQAYLPKSGDQDDLRCFEWYYLAHQCGFRGRPRAREACVTIQHGGAVTRVEIAPDGSAFSSIGADGRRRVFERANLRPLLPRRVDADTSYVSYLALLRKREEEVTVPTSELGWEGCQSEAWGPGGAVLATARAVNESSRYHHTFRERKPVPNAQKLEPLATTYQPLAIGDVEIQARGGDVLNPLQRYCAGWYPPFAPFRQVVAETNSTGRTLWLQSGRSEPMAFSPDGSRLAVTVWTLEQNSKEGFMSGKTIAATSRGQPTCPLAALGAGFVCSRAQVEIRDTRAATRAVAFDIPWTQPVFSLALANTGNAVAVIEPPHHLHFDPSGQLQPRDRQSREHNFKGRVSVLMPGQRLQLSRFPDCVAFSPDGRWFAGLSAKTHVAEIVDVQSGVLRSIENLAGTRIAFSSDSTLLTSWADTLPETLKEARPLSGTMKEAKAVLREQLDLRSNTSVELREVGDGRLHARLHGHRYAIRAVAFAPDGKTIATGSDDTTIKLWDLHTGLEKCTLKGHTESVSCLAFGLDGSVLVSGSKDGTVRLWHGERMRPAPHQSSAKGGGQP